MKADSTFVDIITLKVLSSFGIRLTVGFGTQEDIRFLFDDFVYTINYILGKQKPMFFVSKVTRFHYVFFHRVDFHLQVLF